MIKTLIATTALSALALPAHATIGVTGASFTYAQSFDSLSSATSTATVAWANDTTLSGWSLFTGGGNPITTYLGHNGSVNNGSFYSFGTTGSTDRALGGAASGGAYFGSPSSGAVAGYIAVAFTNTSSVAFDSFTLGFDGEQWRNGGNTSAQTMVLQYGYGATFGSVAAWTTPGGSFNWTSPVVGSTAAAVVGNSAGLVSGVGGTVATSWTAGQTLWVRWIENNDSGNDHGLAIDNLSFSVTSAVPEPGTYAMLLAGLAALGFIARRRQG